MKKFSSVAAVLALFASSALAQTSPTPDRAREGFAKLDTNHDGFLSLAEWKAGGRFERGFNIVDANGDGKVTLEELRAAMTKYHRDS